MPDPPDYKIHPHPHSKSSASPISKRRIAEHAYAELCVTSNFTFLTGASHPDEFVYQAAELGYHAIAVADHNSVAGIVRAHVAAKEAGFQFIVGCRLVFTDPDWLSLLVYPTSVIGYGNLCKLLTKGKRRAPKGECYLYLDDLVELSDGMLAVILPPKSPTEMQPKVLSSLRQTFDDDRLSMALARLYAPREERRIQHIFTTANRFNIPLVATNDVYYHIPERRPLQDIVTCVHHHCTLQEAGFRLFPNGERYLKPPDEIARLFAHHPDTLSRTVEIAERAGGFSLDDLRYEYPDETCPDGMGPMTYLRYLTFQGANKCYPDGVPQKVLKQLEHEFALIDELGYAPYFLTVHDIVRYARSQGILCQGRGAAANSAVCYCLGVTSVDPDRINVLFERFVSRERNEPPDIDIDFENKRREEVMQYIYNKYSRDRAALTATVITYRHRSAVWDVGKVLGFSLDAIERIAKRVDRWEKNPFTDARSGSVAAQLDALGFDLNDITVGLLIYYVDAIVGFPRHLSQHVGGFVITRGRLDELVPIDNAAMPDRTVIEWDKDDIDALGILKIDVLALGMLTCIQKAFGLLENDLGQTYTLATIPAEDPKVYAMMEEADTIGVFQIESRAQRTMLPRLKPRDYYDLVIEVAIVRPGPIIGQMVHPYLRRRRGEEVPYYPDDIIKGILKRTLGVPLFQEQVMALAIHAAGFTPGEAEQLRRAITAWTSKDKVARYTTRFIDGMLANGYSREFAVWCYQRMKGFSQYGFPESHAASFALLVYASSWIKCHYPAVFAAALLNSQPMGFYAPAQLIQDAEKHGVTVKSIDVNHSQWDCTLEDDGASLRLGMRQVKGLKERDANAIANAVQQSGSFENPFDLWVASEVPASSLRILARADCYHSMNLDRQHALWEVENLDGQPLPLLDGLSQKNGNAIALPPTQMVDEVARDYQITGYSLKAHPMSFLRESLTSSGVLTAAEVKDEKNCPHGRFVAVGGIVLFRQRPGTAKGVMFMTLEDETGHIDLIVRPNVYERFRNAAIYAKLVIVHGRVERDGKVVHVLATKYEDIEHQAEKLPRQSRDFR